MDNNRRVELAQELSGIVIGTDDAGSESDHGEEEETDADYRARIMHVDAFLRLNDSISSLQEIGKSQPEYALEVQKLLQSSFSGAVERHNDAAHATETTQVDKVFVDRPHTTSVPALSSNLDNVDLMESETDRYRTRETCDNDTEKVVSHAHLIYHGDLLQLSKETVTILVPKRDLNLFTRIIDCFKLMILGKHTDEDVVKMRRDHDSLLEMWDCTPNNTLNVGGELNSMMRSTLETPLYFSNSCMAMISCGQMLRNVYVETEGACCETYEQLMAFVRKHMRHNPVDPFTCDCSGRCSEQCKTLMSMIMEVPTIVHNQTYLLQILAYLMYDRFGREEVFINNLKNNCSPGLLDKIPTRVAMLMGTLCENDIARRYRTIRKQLQHLNPLRGHAVYNKNALDKLVQLSRHPHVQALIELLPGAGVATVELRLPKCATGKHQCLNREFDEKTILQRELNNNGKNKCCGYLRQDPFDVLASSISLVQLLIYLFTDTRSGSVKTRRHYFVRDIITSMAKQVVKIKLDTLEEMFCYLDRTRVFKSFNEHPFMMSALQELFTTYIEYMKDAAEKYKETGKKRRIKRYLKKNGIPDGSI